MIITRKYEFVDEAAADAAIDRIDRDWETAKIVQVLTRPSAEYKQQVADAQVRDLDGVIQKLNTTYQQDLKDEMEAENFFLT